MRMTTEKHLITMLEGAADALSLENAWPEVVKVIDLGVNEINRLRARVAELENEIHRHRKILEHAVGEFFD